MPAPKLTVDPAVKAVFEPSNRYRECLTWLARTRRHTGDSGCTRGYREGSGAVRGVPPVVTVTSRDPTVAPGAIDRFTVKLVGPPTEIELIVMPAPKFTDEAAEKLVFEPVIVTLRLWPCCPLFGATLVIAAGDGVTENRPVPVTGVPPVVTTTSRDPRAGVSSDRDVRCDRGSAIDGN